MIKSSFDMLKKIVSFLLFLGISISSIAQENKAHDSLLGVYKSVKHDTSKVRLLSALYWEVAYSDIELSKNYAQELIALSKEKNLKEGLGKGYFYLAGYYEINTVTDSARHFLDKSHNIFEELKDDAYLSRISRIYSLLDYTEGNLEEALERSLKNLEYKKQVNDSSGIASEFNFIGGIYDDLGKVKLANEYKFEALKIYDLIDDDQGKADTYVNLSTFYLGEDKYTKVIDFSSKALEIYIEQRDKYYQSFAYFQLGQAYYELGKFEVALENLHKGYNIAKDIEANRFSSMISLQLGSAYFKLNDFDLSDVYLNEALNFSDPIGNRLHYTIIVIALSEVYNEKNELTKALAKAEEAITLLDSINNLDLKRRVYTSRSKSFEKIGNFKKSLLDYKTAIQFRDSIYSKEKTQQIEELRTVYETEKKEQQITIQKNKIDLLNSKEKMNRLQKLLLGLGLLLALITAYAFYLRNKRNRLAKEKAVIDLEYKTKELTTHALHLAKKNEVLSDLKSKAKALKQDANADPGYQMLIQTINFDLQDDANWENFSRYFEQVHKDFNKNVKNKFPSVTKNDLRLMALLKMNLSSKEIANILNISAAGIKKARNRLRKKLDIAPQDSLEALIISI